MMEKLSLSEKKPHRIITVVRWLFLSYIAIAAFIGTAIMVLSGFGIYRHYTRTVTLPNGFVLAPTRFNRSNIQILDERGDAVVTSVDSVMWCNDIVYGDRHDVVRKHHAVKKDTKRNGDIGVSYAFIYDRHTQKLYQYETSVSYSFSLGSTHSIYFSGAERAFENRLKELGAPEFSYKKSIRYLDVLHGLDKFPKDEQCRTTNSR